MVYGTEKPLTKRGRVLIAAVLSLVVGIPLFVGLWFIANWWVLLFVVPAAWALWDWVKRGDMFSVVDHGVSHHLRTGEDGRDRFGPDD